MPNPRQDNGDSRPGFTREDAPSASPEPCPKATPKKTSKGTKSSLTKDRKKRGGLGHVAPLPKLPKGVKRYNKIDDPVKLGRKDSVLVGMSTRDFVKWAKKRELSSSTVMARVEVDSVENGKGVGKGSGKGKGKPELGREQGEKLYTVFWDPMAFNLEDFTQE